MAAESAWKLGGLTVGQLAKRVWQQIDEDDIFNYAAALAYYFLLALFPAMLFLMSLLGLFAHQAPEMRTSMMQYLARVLPSSASGLVQQTLDQVMRASGGGKLSLGLLASLWSASAGVVGMMGALNDVYDVREDRPIWKTRAIAVGLTMALSVLIISALLLVLYGGRLAELVGRWTHLGGPLTLTWKMLQWPVVLLFLLFAFALVYYVGPAVKDQKWHWITPGSLLGVLLWLAASIGFRVYLHYFNSYSATYGALGAVIILMLWLYVSGLAFLVGAEVNAEIEHAAAEHGDPEAKARGEKEPHHRGTSEQEAQRRMSEKRPAA